MWWKVLLDHNGKRWFYNIKADDILTAVNLALVTQECDVACVWKAKQRSIGPSLQKMINLFPERILFRGCIEEGDGHEQN